MRATTCLPSSQSRRPGEVPRYGTPARPASGWTTASRPGYRPPGGRYYIWGHVGGPALIDVHLNGGTFNLTGSPQRGTGRGDHHRHANLRYRQPPLSFQRPRRASPRNSSAGHRPTSPDFTAAAVARRYDIALKTARRTCHQRGGSSRSRGLPRPYRPRRGHGRRPVLKTFWPTGRMSSLMYVQRPGRDGAGAGTRRRGGCDHGTSRRPAPLPAGYLEASRNSAVARHRLYSRRGANRADAHREMWGISKPGIERTSSATDGACPAGYPIAAVLVSSRMADRRLRASPASAVRRLRRGRR